MSRMRDTLKRGGSFRDSRLVVIACEGAKTEREYFEQIKHSFRQSRLRIHVVERENPGESSPRSVVQSLLDHKESEGEPDDYYWVVFDRDEQSWSERQIHQAIQICNDRDLNWAISNPFFELWLVMHFALAPETIAAFGTDAYAIKRYVGEKKGEFGGNLGGYYEALATKMNHAIDMANQCGCCNDDLIPAYLCTQVYRLARQLVDLS